MGSVEKQDEVDISCGGCGKYNSEDSKFRKAQSVDGESGVLV